MLLATLVLRIVQVDALDGLDLWGHVQEFGVLVGLDLLVLGPHGR